MHLPFNFYEKLRNQIAIAEIVAQKVTLTKKGHEYTGLCPFHNEKTPSFTVSNQKRFYHCFGCGAHGDVIRFVGETAGMTYAEAAKKLAEDNGIEIPKLTPAQAKIYEESDEILHVLSLANQFFTSHLSPLALKYLTERKISEKVIKDYDIGFAPTGSGLVEFLEAKKIPLKTMYSAGLIGKSETKEIYPIFRNRVIFPIKNIYGKVIAFGGRIIGEGQPKYLNSPETLIFKKSETLYGEDKATGAAYQKQRIIVVEGYMDVIAMQTAGIMETVATLGTAVTAQHLAKLWRVSDEIIFCMDGDNAGRKSMQRVISTALPIMKGQQKVSFLVLPERLDPDDAVRELGTGYMEDLIAKRLSLSEMIWHLETRGKNFNTPEAKASLEGVLEEYIKLSSNIVLAKYIRSEFKNKIWSLGRKTKPEHSSTIAPLTNLMGAIEIILYNIFALILKSPIVLEDEKIYNEFIEMEIGEEKLDTLRMHILDIYSHSGKLDIAELERISQNCGFSDVFVLLSSRLALFIDKMSLESLKIDPKFLWQLWSKRLECEVLKKEYGMILSNPDEESFNKARSYITQIAIVEKAILQMTEEMLG